MIPLTGDNFKSGLSPRLAIPVIEFESPDTCLDIGGQFHGLDHLTGHRLFHWHNLPDGELITCVVRDGFLPFRVDNFCFGGAFKDVEARLNSSLAGLRLVFCRI